MGAEFLEDTLMLTPMDSSNKFSMLLMELDSVLLTLVFLLLLPSTQSLLLPQHSTQSLLLLLPSTLSLLLPQFTLVLHQSQSKTPQRLQRPRLLILLLSLLLMLQLRERGVRLMLLSLEDLPESSLPPPPLSTTHQYVPMLLILMLVLDTMVWAMLDSIFNLILKLFKKTAGCLPYFVCDEH